MLYSISAKITEGIDIASSNITPVYRHELKYSLGMLELIKLRSILSGILETDIHNGNDGYMIRSLYFDSFSDTDYYAKIASEDNRKKIRLRTYNPDSSDIQLELKRKENSNQIKYTFPITKADAVSLTECEFDVLSGREDAAMIYNMMKLNRVRPVVMVDYRRFAFVHPSNNVRITLDTDIKSSESNFDIWDKNAVLTPVDTFEAGVLEIKYEGFFPAWIAEILSEYIIDRTDNSKYTNSRSLFAKYSA